MITKTEFIRVGRPGDYHFVIVSDGPISEGDFCYDPAASPGFRGIKGVTQCLRTAPDSYWNQEWFCKKITHSTQPLEYYEDDRQGWYWDRVQQLGIPETRLNDADEAELEAYRRAAIEAPRVQDLAAYYFIQGARWAEEAKENERRKL